MSTIESEIFERVCSLLSSELELSRDIIRIESRLGHEPWWDSLAHLHILLTIGGEFDFILDAELARQLTSMRKILHFLCAIEAASQE